MRVPGLAVALALAAAVVTQTPVAASVPTTISFSARLVDDDTGEAITGAHHLELALFDAETGGTAVFDEGRDLDLEDGLVLVDIGETKPLDPAIFAGRLFLEVKIDDVVLEPRVRLSSVPYSLRSEVAANAEALGGLTADQVQQRVTGGCETGNFIIGVNADGSVACAPDLSGSGDITDVLAGSGLQGGGTAGSVTLALVDCGVNQVLKFTGTVWACAADADSGGDITAVTATAGGGLAGGGTSGDVALSLIACANGQILKFTGGAWACGTDVDTNSGGDITSIVTGGNSGLVGGAAAGDVSLSLLTSCSPGQLLKWNGTAWGCSNDIDTDTNSGGDITDVVAGNGLTGGGSTGSVTVDVGAGTGITVGANTVSLDTTFTDNRYDPRYVNVTGDTMTGQLTMNAPIDLAQQRILNRGCPSGYVRHGNGLCLENIDQGGLTFSSCANRCRAAGTHLCSSGEIRAVMQSGITVGNGGVIGDWVDDQDSTTTALVINSNTDTNAFVAATTTLTNFCRCCANVE